MTTTSIGTASGRDSASRRITEQEVFLAAVVAFPFMIANARMLRSLPGFPLFSVLREVSTTALIIPFIIIVLYFYLRHGLRTSPLAGGATLVPILVLSVGGSLFSETSFKELVQGLYMVFMPPLIAQTILGFDRWSVRPQRIMAMLLTIAAVNVLPGLYTFLQFGLGGDVYFTYRGYRVNRFDVVNGFFSDSHQFSIFFFMMAVFAAGYYHRQRRTMVLLAGALTAVGFLGYNAKALLVFLLLAGVFAVAALYRKRPGLVVVAGLAAAGLSGALYSVAVDYDNRIELFTDISPADAPVLNPLLKVVDVYSEHPEVAVAGAGFGNYGSTIAVARANATGAMSPLARKHNGYSIWAMTSKDETLNQSSEFISFLSFNINTLTSLFVEIGFIAGFSLMAFYWRTVHRLLVSGDEDRYDPAPGRAIAFYLIFVFINSLLVLWGSYDDEVAIIPAMVLAASELRNRTARTP